MNDSKRKEDDSDVTSNASWTVIEESDDSKKSSIEKLDINDEDDIESNYKDFENLKGDPEIQADEAEGFASINFKNKTNNKEDCQNDVSGESGFLTFDEYVQERMLELDYDCGESMENLKKSYKKICKEVPKKRKADSINIMSITACLLTITGLTLLFLMAPQTVDKNTLNKVQNNYLQVASNQGNTVENLVNNLNKTGEVIALAKENKLLETSAEVTMSQSKKHEINDSTVENIINEKLPSKLKENKAPIEQKYTRKFYTKNNKVDKASLPLNLHPRISYALSGIKRILLNTNFHFLLCNVMQDICMLKLISHINKTYDEKAKKQIPEKEPHASEKPVKKSKKTKLSSISKQKFNNQTPQIQEISQEIYSRPEDFIKGKLLKLTPDKEFSSFDSKFLTPRGITKRYIQEIEENGKTECQRRFEELDTKWETVGHNHRQKIQKIKQKFQNEVIRIKENETETTSRRQKINIIREKYIQRLKLDREKYLFQLRKLREERQKIMNDICKRKKILQASQKDAAVGSYAVLLPGSYDFQQKLKLIKDKENTSKLLVSLPNITGSSTNVTLVDTEKISKLPQYLSHPNLIFNETLSSSSSLKARKSGIKKLLKLSGKNSKASRLSDMMLCEAPLNEVEENFENNNESQVPAFIASNRSQNMFTPCSSTNDPDEDFSSDVEISPIDENRVNEFKVVLRRKSKTKHDLYGLAFGRKSQKIRNADLLKWNNNMRNISHIQTISKQDPQKAFKDKVSTKGLKGIL